MNKKRFLNILYTLATVLMIVGALLIFQGLDLGLNLLAGGVGLNIIYRSLTLDFEKIKAYVPIDMLRLANILLMCFACILFFTETDQKFNLLILVIVLDLALNFKEISLKTK